MKINLVLTGAYAGKTIVLNGTKFVGGKHTLIGNIGKFEHLIKYFAYYGGYLEGSDELQAAQKRDAANGKDVSQESKGSGEGADSARQPAAADVPNGDGPDGDSTHSESESLREENTTMAGGDNVTGGSHTVTETHPKVLKLRRVLMALDPKDDSQWNEAGLPKLSAVEKGYGAADVTRADLEAAIPGWDREAAKGAASVI